MASVSCLAEQGGGVSRAGYETQAGHDKRTEEPEQGQQEGDEEYFELLQQIAVAAALP